MPEVVSAIPCGTISDLGANLALIDLREERIKALAKNLERDNVTISTHCTDAVIQTMSYSH